VGGRVRARAASRPTRGGPEAIASGTNELFSKQKGSEGADREREDTRRSLKVASYYREQAKKLEQDKDEHIEMAAEYDRYPKRYPKKPAVGQHCRDAAGYYNQEAAAARGNARGVGKESRSVATGFSIRPQDHFAL
jgi:hypothetical protein